MRFLTALAAVAAVTLPFSVPADAQTKVKLEEVAGGLTHPLAMVSILKASNSWVPGRPVGTGKPFTTHGLNSIQHRPRLSKPFRSLPTTSCRPKSAPRVSASP